MYGCVCLPSGISSREFVLIDTSLYSSYVDESWIEAEIDSYSSVFNSFSTKLPSSNCAKVIMLPVFHEIM